MGIHKNIGYSKFPKQGNLLFSRVDVSFNYDTSKIIQGRVIRDDREDPFETIIELDNGHVVRSVECQLSLRKSYKGD